MPENLRVSWIFSRSGSLGYNFQLGFIPHSCYTGATYHYNVYPQPGACRGIKMKASAWIWEYDSLRKLGQATQLFRKKGPPNHMESPRTLAPVWLSELGPEVPSIPLRSLPSIHSCHQLLTSTQQDGSFNVPKQLSQSQSQVKEQHRGISPLCCHRSTLLFLWRRFWSRPHPTHHLRNNQKDMALPFERCLCILS